MEMRKCNRCNPYGNDKPELKEAELWQEMVDSLMHFTETSTALMKGMQNKLGMQPDSDPEKDISNHCELLEKLKEDLSEMDTEEKVSSVCTCTSQTNILDNSNPDEEITAEIACYKPPRVIRKKKYKYSTEIESKLLAQKKRVPPCQCNMESANMTVDVCICKNIPERFSLREACNDTIALCSPLTQDDIENIYCVGEILEEQKEEEKKEDDPLAWIRKPGSFDPDKLPQDDNHPFVIKTPDDKPIENHSLGHELLSAMRKFGDNNAQIDNSSGKYESYSEYAEKCILVATKLKNELSKHDIIGICTDNHKNAYIPYIAGLFNRNRVVAFDRFSDRKEMMNCLENVTPNIMFVSENCLDSIQECMRVAKLNFKIVLFGEGDNTDFVRFDSYLYNETEPTENFEAEKIDSLEEACLICFTGGISEKKAVCLSHAALLRQSLRIVSSQLVPPVIMSFIENFQMASLLVLFSSVLSGATRIIIECFGEQNLWKIIEKYQINALHLYPYHCTKLADLPEPEEDTSSLMYIFTGGEKLQPTALARLKEILLRTIICQTYENTELSGAITSYNFSRPEDSIFSYFRTKSCGRPIDGVWYKVIDVQSGKMVHHMAPGELFVKTKLIRNGYMIKNTEENFDKDDWISTGDLVFYDTYKCFHHMNRICDLIKFRATKIIPSKLEDILMSHPLISMAIVLAIPNEEDGQHAAAVVTVKETEDIYSKDLEEWFKIKVPEEEQLRGGIRIVGNIPYSHNGKLNRQQFLS